MTGRVAGLLLTFTLCGCGDDQSTLERARLGIHAADTKGRSADIACEELPLLQGSRIFTTHVIDDRVIIEVIAEPGEVTLHFKDQDGNTPTVQDEEDRTLTNPHTLPRGLLLNGGESELVKLRLYDGALYTVTLSMGCEK